MSIHLNRDLEEAHRELLALSGLVEEMIDKASAVLMRGNLESVEWVIASDSEVDQCEVRIEEQCLKMLALHQPVAIDLRRIATMMKVNNELERVADLAVNLTERARDMHRSDKFPVPEEMPRMLVHASQMIRGALDCFVNLDSRAARHIVAVDDEIDASNRKVIDELRELMRKSPSMVDAALHCFSASRQIERIADHATNIAEDVIYLVEGAIVRHRHGSPESNR